MLGFVSLRRLAEALGAKDTNKTMLSVRLCVFQGLVGVPCSVFRENVRIQQVESGWKGKIA